MRRRPQPEYRRSVGNESSTQVRRDRDEPGTPEPFRLIVVVDGERTVQDVVQFDRAPRSGETISAVGRRVTIRHVIHASRRGVAGIVLAWPADGVGHRCGTSHSA